MGIIIITFIINSIGIALLLFIFDSGIENVIKRALILSIILTVVTCTGYAFGIIGVLISAVLNFVLVSKILGYNLTTSFLFIVGLELIKTLFAFGTLGK